MRNRGHIIVHDGYAATLLGSASARLSMFPLVLTEAAAVTRK